MPACAAWYLRQASVRGLRDGEHTLEQDIDRRGRGFADRAVGRGRIGERKQALALRRLAQQFRARALAKRFGRERLSECVQRDAVDAGDCDCDGGRVGHGRRLHQSAAPGWPGALRPAGTLRRRLRTN